MKRRIAKCALLTLLMLFTSNLDSTKQPYLTVCNVLTSPEKYEGKEITIRGTYRVAFEASQLYSLSCPDSGPVWVGSLPCEPTELTHRAVDGQPPVLVALADFGWEI